MTTLKQIRAEIESEYNKFRNMSEVWDERANGIGTALDIIDKYADQSGWEEITVPCKHCGKDMTFKIAVCGEPKSPCDLCRYDYIDGVCGDCPAMAKAEWER